MVGDALGLTDFLEVRALESADGLAWRPLRGTSNGLLVRANSGVVFTPHVAWRMGSLINLLFVTRSSFAVISYTNNWVYVVFAAVGSWVGAYITMTFLHGAGGKPPAPLTPET